MTPSRGPRHVPGAASTSVRVVEGADLVPYGMDSALPGVQSWLPVRGPVSGAKSRHIPVSAFSVTMGAHLHLESGLEHDLVRLLDRDPGIDLLLAQPCEIRLPDGRRHVPDLLSSSDDEITTWDARAQERRDESFSATADLTAEHCELRGWSYRLFGGLESTQRINLLWLNGFRRAPNWLSVDVELMASTLAAGPVPLSELFALDGGDGGLRASVWHLLWAGRLVIDHDVAWTPATLIGSA